jgi:hypothetical protein
MNNPDSSNSSSHITRSQHVVKENQDAVGGVVLPKSSLVWFETFVAEPETELLVWFRISAESEPELLVWSSFKPGLNLNSCLIW